MSEGVTMDPNACLEEIRRLSAQIDRQANDLDVEEMQEAFRALDGWLSKGGFLPTAWER